jgi:hypothetical protein
MLLLIKMISQDKAAGHASLLGFPYSALRSR